MQRGNGRLTPKYLLRERPVKWDPSYDLTTGTITVHVTRKAVKNFNLRVRSDGTAVMSIPWQTNRQKAQAFLDKHRYWLKRSIAQALEKQPEAPDDGLVPLWGRLVELPCDLAVDGAVSQGSRAGPPRPHQDLRGGDGSACDRLAPA